MSRHYDIPSRSEPAPPDGLDDAVEDALADCHEGRTWVYIYALIAISAAAWTFAAWEIFH